MPCRRRRRSSTSRPSGLNEPAEIGARAAARTRSSGAVPGSQTRAVPSALAVATAVPSGLKAPFVTESVWPRRTASSRPVAASQTRAVPSVARRDEELAVLAEGGAVNGVGMTEHQRDTRLPSRVSQTRVAPSRARRHDSFPSGPNTRVGDPALVIGEHVQPAPVVDAPDRRGVVLAARDQERAGRVEARRW